jgi:hypothetical protein
VEDMVFCSHEQTWNKRAKEDGVVRVVRVAPLPHPVLCEGVMCLEVVNWTKKEGEAWTCRKEQEEVISDGLCHFQIRVFDECLRLDLENRTVKQGEGWANQEKEEAIGDGLEMSANQLRDRHNLFG